MNKTNVQKKMQSDIAAAVRKLVEVVQRSTLWAVEEAFSGSSTLSSGVSLGSSSVSASRPVSSSRRSQATIAELCERLYAAICASPGLSMAELCTQVGSTTAQLSLPAVQLKKSERIRTVGERAHTRYYPRVRPPVD